MTKRRRGEDSGRRYDPATVAGVIEPTGERIPREGGRSAGKLDIVHAALPAPGELSAYDLQFGKSRRVAVNRRVDILETEYAHARLTARAYEAGRYIDLVLTRALDGGGGALPSDDGRQSLSPYGLQVRLAQKMDAARTSVEMKRGMIKSAGVDATRRVLLAFAGVSFVSQAHAEKCWEDGVAPSFTAQRRRAHIIATAYRRALEAIADDWERHGKP